ncbi:MAG: c-type cytochrome biogenesis protein CcmI [Methylococcales bacterium]|nr:c-type cytochrome biogenesis protein CcmI [Methylococcales bacterium]
MNIAYWLVIAMLIILALLIIIPPLWRNREIKDADSDQRNINIAQERAKDLKRQLEAGGLTQLQYDEQYAELELSLGDDLDLDTQSQLKSSQGRWIVPVIGLLLPVFSVLIYFGLGEPEALRKAQTQQQMRAAQSSNVNIEAMVSGLVQRLEKEPDNAKGWVMLGRSYKYLEQFSLAVNAFKKAHELLADDPDIMLHYADSLAMASDGALEGKPTELIFKALEKSPNNMTGLWLGGMVKAEKGEFKLALKYWRQLEELLPKGSQSHKEIQAMLATVQAKVAPEQTIKTAISIKVHVSLTESLKAKAAIDDTVFIYAKALTGSPMPLAIVRKQMADLPLTVTLDDAMAMMPTMKLSNFKQVKVMARVSKTGNAMQQPGDFIGAFTVPKLQGEQSINIVINQEIK